MDLWRIAVRALFMYVLALALVRLGGKRTIGQSDVPSFVVVLVIGDMFDDVLWAEVAVSQFVAGVGALLLVHVYAGLALFRTADRQWKRGA
jgi:uncharacterized membrane protein YcaP (DUF421 family)